jgi:hypothetical protein
LKDGKEYRKIGVSIPFQNFINTKIAGALSEPDQK